MCMAEEGELQPLNYRGRPPPLLRPPPIFEDPESRLWRYRRQWYRAGLFAVGAVIALYFGPNLLMFGKLTRLAPADFVTTVEKSSAPVVLAMKRYERDHGHRPQQMTDLIPKYLPGPTGTQFVLNGEFTQLADDNEMISYDFEPSSEGWYVSGPFAKGRIPLPPVTLAPTTGPVPAKD